MSNLNESMVCKYINWQQIIPVKAKTITTKTITTLLLILFYSKITTTDTTDNNENDNYTNKDNNTCVCVYLAWFFPLFMV